MDQVAPCVSAYQTKPNQRRGWRTFRFSLYALGFIWLTAVGAGLAILINHETAPTIASAPPQQWPLASQITPSSQQPTLLVFAHPHCPCTRATMQELALIMAQCQDKVSAYVVLSKPQTFADSWAQSDVGQSAAAIPGVKILLDNDYAEAKRFQAESSGATILYDQTGHLIFNGGITGSRGHAGSNFGRSAIIARLQTGAAEHQTTPVFGCSIFSVNCETTSKGNHETFQPELNSK